ncbi:unnamed protein product [Mytilus coruscus]|uniref:Uncharacterized protein n=1 Tax=Mytilus coruscus TaxID=42192 RepID=A0A6J8BW02_MYTCO|nr:unnamed protein product [Mytilus coruscus]
MALIQENAQISQHIGEIQDGTQHRSNNSKQIQTKDKRCYELIIEKNSDIKTLNELLSVQIENLLAKLRSESDANETKVELPVTDEVEIEKIENDTSSDYQCKVCVKEQDTIRDYISTDNTNLANLAAALLDEEIATVNRGDELFRDRRSRKEQSQQTKVSSITSTVTQLQEQPIIRQNLSDRVVTENIPTFVKNKALVTVTDINTQSNKQSTTNKDIITTTGPIKD